MNKIYPETIKPFFQNDDATLLFGDSFKILPKLKADSIDMIFADAPYFLSNNGITCFGGRMVSVNKADWDTGYSLKQKHAFNQKWIRRCKRILKPDGTIWVSGTLHNIYSLGFALEEAGFKIINNITWEKTNPPPNLACRCFTHSTETILWAKKIGGRHRFNYDNMKAINSNKQMKDVWEGALTKKSEKFAGKHPTQKPEYLLERIILASTIDGDMVLDPFCGSGTTGVVANRLNRKFIGIDSVKEYLEVSRVRIEKVNDEKRF